MFTRRTDLAILRLTIVLACIFAKPVFPYVLPAPTFEVLRPQGLRVSIPGKFDIEIYTAFHGRKKNVTF